MIRKLKTLIRGALLRLRVHSIDVPPGLSAHSPEYLYLAQQAKRLSLSQTIGRFTLSTILLWPLIAIIVALKWVDLSLANTLVRSMINEIDLQRLAARKANP